MCFFVWPLLLHQWCMSHRAHAGVLNIHPNRVWHHFIGVCMVVGYDAERREHFFGDRNHQGNKELTFYLVTTKAHQLTSAQDLWRQIWTSWIIRHEYMLRVHFTHDMWVNQKRNICAQIQKCKTSLTRIVISVLCVSCRSRLRLIFMLSLNFLSPASTPADVTCDNTPIR